MQENYISLQRKDCMFLSPLGYYADDILLYSYHKPNKQYPREHVLCACCVLVSVSYAWFILTLGTCIVCTLIYFHSHNPCYINLSLGSLGNNDNSIQDDKGLSMILTGFFMNLVSVRTFCVIYDIILFRLANHKATHKVGCQSGDHRWHFQSSSVVYVGMYGLMYSFLPLRVTR